MDSLGRRPFDFMPGYKNKNFQQYMNVGMVKSPYPGKVGVGDYGPLQNGGVYYRPHNPTYPYPMDFNSDSQGPHLAYAETIPTYNRRNDQNLLKNGAFGRKAQLQAQNFSTQPSTSRDPFGIGPTNGFLSENGQPGAIEPSRLPRLPIGQCRSCK